MSTPLDHAPDVAEYSAWPSVAGAAAIRRNLERLATLAGVEVEGL